jgi:2-oxoglutarate ferredoxin oxidoreductase subunit alpha
LDQIVNDLTFQAATVNGSGSQSANLVLTRAIFSMGIPVAPKNVFPSNIEGQPTWYQLRVSAGGWQARKGAPDVLAARNPQTWLDDLRAVRPGGAVVHDETFPLTGARVDVDYFPVPFARLARARIQSDSLRKQLTNLIYVGVTAGLLGIPFEALVTGIERTLPSKPRAWPANIEAARIGHEYWQEHFSDRRIRHTLRAMPGRTDGMILVDGNQAAALGCVMGGCTVAAWYPITPSSSLCESLMGYADRYRTDPRTGERRIAIVQAEDELAAVGIAVGAGWAGARAMTATSGPGISLMAEFTGLAYYAEVPLVIFDVQRLGPSTGLPTRTSQGDLAFVHGLSHGDTRHPVLLPGTVEECYDFAQRAFDLADRFQTPVFILSDLDLGMNLWMSRPFAYPERPFDRGKVLTVQDLERLQGEWARYRDVDGDGIPYRTLPGTDHPAAGYLTRGSGHDDDARYTESPEAYRRTMDRLARKHETARDAVPAPVTELAPGSRVGIIAYGSSHHAVVEARELLAERGVPVSYLRLRALPVAAGVADFVARHERVHVVEQNRDGQLRDLLTVHLPPALSGRLRSIRRYDGQPLAADAITNPLLQMEAVCA